MNKSEASLIHTNTNSMSMSSLSNPHQLCPETSKAKCYRLFLLNSGKIQKAMHPSFGYFCVY